GQDQEHGQRGQEWRRVLHPPPLIRAMIQVVKPQIGEKVYDGACGSAGFLCESLDYMKASKELTTRDIKVLQERTFYGKEKNVPGLCHRNYEYDPPRHRGAERHPYEHSTALRKLLLESCNLTAILDCPSGTFQGAGVKTVVLFFQKGEPTRKIWYYELDPGRKMGKTTPLNDEDLADFVKLSKKFSDSPKSWSVKVSDIDTNSYDLSVKNPNGNEAIVHRKPKDILDEIARLDAESAKALEKIRGLL
ncbi:MAG: HsdM family class I SAM-dependent methyltransferase, partial [Rectinemataceae bacterium]